MINNLENIHLISVQESIELLRDKFRKNPYNYLNEYEVQCDLMSILRDKISDGIQYKHPISDEVCKFLIVRSELRINNRIADIVLYKPNDKTFTNKDMDKKGTLFYTFPINIAFELKACFWADPLSSSNGSSGKLFKIQEDSKKLFDFIRGGHIVTGISLNFFNNKSEDEIEKEFQKYFSVDDNSFEIMFNKICLHSGKVNIVFITLDHPAPSSGNRGIEKKITVW